MKKFYRLCVRNPASGLFQIGCKLKIVNDVTNFRDDFIVKIFLRCFVYFIKFSYWSKFTVNIISLSVVMTIYFQKGLIRNREIRNSPVWVLLNICRLGWVSNAKFGTCVSNKILVNAVKCQGYSFYSFELLKTKPTGSLIYPFPPSPSRLELIKLQAWRPTNAFNKESNTGVFLWNLFKNLFLQITSADCFWKENVKLNNSFVDNKSGYEKQ